jgi:hypothetical protein
MSVHTHASAHARGANQYLTYAAQELGAGARTAGIASSLQSIDDLTNGETRPYLVVKGTLLDLAK